MSQNDTWARCFDTEEDLDDPGFKPNFTPPNASSRAPRGYLYGAINLMATMFSALRFTALAQFLLAVAWLTPAFSRL
jgi:hypothetical protein